MILAAMSLTISPVHTWPFQESCTQTVPHVSVLQVVCIPHMAHVHSFMSKWVHILWFSSINTQAFRENFSFLSRATVMASNFRKKSIIFGYYFLYGLLWRLISILWHFFGCLYFIAHNICRFPLVLSFSKVIAFESPRPLATVLPLFACAYTVVSLRFRHHETLGTLFHLDVDSSLPCSIDFVNNRFRIWKKTHWR